MATRSIARLLLTGAGCSWLSLSLPANVHAQPPEAEEQGDEAPEIAEPLTPPTVLERVQPKWPAGETVPEDAEAEVRVRLLATIEASGELGPVEVAESAGPAFDAAALEALARWRFAAARRGDEAVPVRVPVVMVFRPPETPPEPEAPPAPDEETAPPEQEGPPPDEETASERVPAEDEGEILELTVEGQKTLREQDRGASSFAVKRDMLEAAPRSEGAEVLRSAPGVYVGRGEGMAVAHRYMLRGFDADHGQDIEIHVGGLPINLPAHIHGQGYADLGFLIGETVDELRVIEGVTDPRQGDFAVAGSFDVRLAVPDRGWRIAAGYGRFNAFRQLVLWAPRGQPDETFAAAQYTRSDGFGDNRRGQGASGIVQVRYGPERGRWSHRFVSLMHGARAEHAGVLRRDDIEAGRVDDYGVYPYPTARAQHALAGRIMAGNFSDYRGTRGDNAELGVWAGFDDFRLLSNFTGFTQRSRTLEQVAGRGDLIEQRNRTISVGVTARYRTRSVRPARWARGTLELGLSGRFDHVFQQQNLLDAAVRNQTWDRHVDATVIAADLGLFADLDWSFTEYLRLRVGVRGDALTYDIDDRLGNFTPATRPEDQFHPGFRRTAFGLALGPRTSAELTPLDWLSIRLAYGEGYRSPQARTLDEGERAPFTKVRSADAGLRFGGDADRIQVTTAGYFTWLSDDVAFEPREGRLERIGASRRLGAVLYLTTRPLDWLVGGASLTYVHATLLEPPPPTAEEPEPPFEPGQALPYVPPIVMRVDLGAEHPLARRGDTWEVRGRAGVGLSYLSPRPLPYGVFAEHVPLLDASLGLAVGPLELDISGFNLANQRYAAVEYNFASDWSPDTPRSRVPARHIAAGAPLSFMVTLGVSL